MDGDKIEYGQGKAEAIRIIQDTAVKAQCGTVVDESVEPEHIYLIRNPDGSINKMRADPPLMKAVLTDFRSVIVMARNANAGKKAVSLWYSAAGVTLCVGDDARDRASIGLEFSQPFKMLCEIDSNGGRDYGHLALYKMFRTKFRDYMPNHPDILDRIRKVDISKLKTVKSEVSAGKVSIGRDMLSQAANADKLPDLLTFTVPIFTNPLVPLRVEIRVNFSLEPEEEQFNLTVLPGEIQKALFAGEDHIFQRLVEVIGEDNANDFISFCPIYRGRP